MNYKRVHFIAIGGSVMHNLAIALSQAGLKLSGSDDHFFDPSKSRLEKHGLLPEAEGWFPERITNEVDAVILGMHAKTDNPELIKARELNIPIYSFPEFIYEQARNKQRIVIGGSHGKTSICGIILHILNGTGRPFDYLVGAQVPGFETMVRLSDAPIIVIEGDEYPSSSLDETPKFLNYHHHIGLVSGIAWDHFNIYRDENSYVRQFDLFADATPKAGTLVYNQEDDLTAVICAKEREDVSSLPYKAHEYEVVDGQTVLIYDGKKIPVKLFGYHNMQNISGAKTILKRIGVTEEQFYQHIGSFEGASGRLETILESEDSIVFKDFAHAPSKLNATTRAVKDQYPEKEVVGVMELHTYSSLNKEFLHQYKDTFNQTDHAVIYYNPSVLEQKKLDDLDEGFIRECFDNPNLKVFTDADDLKVFLTGKNWSNTAVLFMSSGNFGGLDLEELGREMLESS